MAAGSATPQRLGTIDPSSLIGQAETIVEPRAVAALTDAFRQGVVSSDDIVSRIGQLGTSKKKAEIMQAQEAVSPEAQLLRQRQTEAGTAQAQAATVKAGRAMVIEQYPAIAYFDKLAPAAGIEAPTLPDGSPDYQQMEKIGAQLAVHQAQRAEAQAKLDNIEDIQFGTNSFSKTKQGEIVDQNYVAQLRKQATAPFQQQAPGSVQTMVEPRMAPTTAAPAPSPIAATGEPIDQLRARMAEKFGVEKVIQLSEDELRRLDAPAPMVTPKAPPTAAPAPVIDVGGVPAAGTRVGMGTSLGPPATQLGKPIDPAEKALQIAKSKEIMPGIDSAIAAVQRGTGVGALEGSLPAKIFNRVGAAFGAREQEFADQRSLEIGISTKILEGAQVLKGNLSDKDVRFLKDTVPKLSDSEDVWINYLNRWKRMAETNTAILEGRIPKPQADLFAPEGWQPDPQGDAKDAAGNFFSPPATLSPAGGSGPGKVITLRSGIRVQRDAQGNYKTLN